MEFSASDVLAPQLWTGKTERPTPGIDVACTKIAVDLQNLPQEGVEEVLRHSLEALREAISADSAFLLLVDGAATRIESVVSAHGHFGQCRPEDLRGVALTTLPWLMTRSEHLRLSEFRDTAAARDEQSKDAAVLANLALGSALLVGFRLGEQAGGFLGVGYGLPRAGFDVNLQLLMKLLGSSLAKRRGNRDDERMAISTNTLQIVGVDRIVDGADLQGSIGAHAQDDLAGSAPE